VASRSVLPSQVVFQAFQKGLNVLNLPHRLKGIAAKRRGASVFVVVRQVVAGITNGANSLIRGIGRSGSFVRERVKEDVIYRTLASLKVCLWKLLPRLGSERNTAPDDLLIIDDTPLPKPRAKRMAGLSFHYSTTARKSVHGLLQVKAQRAIPMISQTSFSQMAKKATTTTITAP